MKKIPGDVIMKPVEVGAKYIAEDGSEFATEAECMEYEHAAKKAKEKAAYKEAYNSIVNSKCLSGSPSSLRRKFIKRFDTKEDFVNTYRNLDFKHCYSDTYCSYDGNFLKEEWLPNFPTWFVIYYTYKTHPDDNDSVYFDFIEAEAYIADLTKKIDKVREAMNE